MCFKCQCITDVQIYTRSTDSRDNQCETLNSKKVQVGCECVFTLASLANVSLISRGKKVQGKKPYVTLILVQQIGFGVRAVFF